MFALSNVGLAGRTRRLLWPPELHRPALLRHRSLEFAVARRHPGEDRIAGVVAIESITWETEGWERDRDMAEPSEPDSRACAWLPAGARRQRSQKETEEKTFASCATGISAGSAKPQGLSSLTAAPCPVPTRPSNM